MKIFALVMLVVALPVLTMRVFLWYWADVEDTRQRERLRRVANGGKGVMVSWPKVWAARGRR